MKYSNYLSLWTSLSIIFLIGLPSCDSEEATKKQIANDPKSATLEDFHWIEGKWIDSKTFGFKSPPQLIVEEWKVYPDSISGRGYFIKGTDTTLTELLSIVKTDDQIVYVARPVGQAVIGFPFKGIDQDQYLFENKSHDFPQKIGYHPIGSDSLDIYMVGISNGFERKLKYTFAKEK